ncbi:pilus assembly protein CpaB [Nocardioides sp. JQ2195]|uniref:Flp pilus assembly protein CpaB n=1 Tax=Nocardioides sp. JQ2195 TaxID=2592334 RepID=UPI00143ED7EE|nr:SAF domain-containing protein [Nocardioides sp. JQ2195]QIX28017.1 pilus assembly protein CpaB [Nocardioides sp. JQ2195]
MAANTPTDLRRRLADVHHTMRRAVLGRRRLLCALCVVGAVFAGLRALAPAPPSTVPVTVAARDLPAGSTVAAGDVETVGFPEGTVPTDTSDAAYAVGRTTTGPLRRGEPITDARLVGASLLEGYPGLVAIPVRIPDDGAAALLRVGDRIDLLATDQRTGATERVGDDIPVIALPHRDVSGQQNALAGRLIVVGTTSELSEKVASASATRYLTATISR